MRLGRRALVVGGTDTVQETGPDDAAAPPDRRHRAAVDVPVIFVAARADLVEALGVRDDLGGVEGPADVLDERVPVIVVHRGQVRSEDSRAAWRCPAWPGQRPRERRLGDPGDRDAEVQRALHGPAAGALLLRLVAHTSTNGLPVAVSVCDRTSAVIWIR